MIKRRFNAILLLVLFAALFACKKQVNSGSIEVQSVVMNKLTTSMLVGATETLSAVITPDEAENKAVAWSTSDVAVATVSAQGVVTGLSEGTTTITATTQEGGYKTSCVVTVSNTVVAVTGVALNHETTTMVVGTTSALAVTVAPQNATNQNVDWSTSDETIATVSAQGVVTAVSEGTATITVATQEGGYKTSCVVTVSNAVVAVTGVALNHETTTMVVGATAALAATVAPVAATNQNVAYSTSDEAIATVSAEGAVTAVAEGTATITATTQDGGYTAICVVTVSNAVILVAEVTLDQSAVSIESGSTATLVAAIAPQDATNKNLDWSTSDVAVATVSAEGVVTAVSQGTATITVTTQDGTKTATCEVTVVVSVTGVTLNRTTDRLVVGKTSTLVATVAPQGATNKNIDWSTSDEAIATVSAEGAVTAVAEGTATITATTQDGAHTATCVVTVPQLTLGWLKNNPSGTIGIAGATVTVSSPNAPAGMTWTAELSNTTGFTLGEVTGSGPTGAVAVTVGENPTNEWRSSTLNVTASNGTTTSTTINQSAALLNYSSPSSRVPEGKTKSSVTFTVTGTLGLTVSLAKTGGDADFSAPNPVTLTCDGTPQTVTVTMTANTKGTRSALYSATVTNAGASGLDKTDIKVSQLGDYVQVGNFEWTTGNLVSTTNSTCKIGEPSDHGLYFQFGSLIGWKGGALENGGTGVGATPYTEVGTQWWGGASSYSWDNDAMVWPTTMVGTPSEWPRATSGTAHQWYFSGNGVKSGTINVTDATKGVGDPCAYYLGGTWRLPTKTELVSVCGFRTGMFSMMYTITDSHWSWATYASTGIIGAFSPGLTFIPTSGTRSGLGHDTGAFVDVGITGSNQASSLDTGTWGDLLEITSKHIRTSRSNRHEGKPVRCVRPV